MWPNEEATTDGDRPARQAVSVVVVDDQAASRRALRVVVDASSALVFAGEAESGEAAIELVCRLAPDLVLMDVRMPGLGGIRTTREIKRIMPETVVVLVSTVYPDELPHEASSCRADAIVWKGTLRPKLLDQVWAQHSKKKARLTRF
jgi:two-component system invasion response regulator UvrY